MTFSNIPLPNLLSPVPVIPMNKKRASLSYCYASPHNPDEEVSCRPSTGGSHATGYLFSELADENNRAHFKRVHEQLVISMDLQVQEIEHRLKEKDNVLEALQEEKKDSGTELYKSLKEVVKLNEALANVRNILNKTESHRKIMEMSRDEMSRDVTEMSQEKK
ncbi:hypothetical protein HK096_006765, partial [Nowakowskiella sp. JEL0078]